MQKTLVRLFSGLLLLTILFLTFGFTNIASAHSAHTLAKCSQNGCNNTDPYATGCASTTNPNTKKFLIYAIDGDAYVWLMYSPACGTNWTEIHTAYDDHVEYFYAKINRAAGPDGGALSFAASSNKYKWFNSNQVYSLHNKAQACGAAGSASVNCTSYL